MNKLLSAVVALAAGVSTVYAGNTPATWDSKVKVADDYITVVGNIEAPAMVKGQGVTTNYGAYFTVDSGSTLKSLKATGLPAGVSIDAKSFALKGKPSKDGIYWATITAANLNGYSHSIVQKYVVGDVDDPADEYPADAYLEDEIDDNLWVGMDYRTGYLREYVVPAEETLTVSGLPAGLKLVTDKYPESVGGKTVYFVDYWIEGRPTKVGKYTVTFMQKYKGDSATYVTKKDVIVSSDPSAYVTFAAGANGSTTAKSAVYAAGAAVKATAKADKDYVSTGWYGYNIVVEDEAVTTNLWPVTRKSTLDVVNGDGAGRNFIATFAPKSADTNIVFQAWDHYAGDDLEEDPVVFDDGVEFDVWAWSQLLDDEGEYAGEGSAVTVTSVKAPKWIEFEKEDEWVEFWWDEKTVPAPGKYEISVTVKNVSGTTATKTITVVVPNSDAALIDGDSAGAAWDEENLTLTLHVGTKIAADEALSIGFDGCDDVKSTSLPAGLSFKDGKIIGTPTKAGEYSIVFTGKYKNEKGKIDAALDESANITIKVVDDLYLDVDDIVYVPDYENLFDLDGIVAVNSDSAATLTFKGLPSGVSYVAKDNVLKGKATAGVYTVKVTAKNKSQSVEKELTLVVPNSDTITLTVAGDAVTAVAVTAGADAADKEIAVAVEEGYRLSAKGLPAGLKLGSDGKISGKATAKAGEYKVVFTATKSGVSETFAAVFAVAYPAVTVEAVYTDDSEASDKVTGAGDYAVGKKVALKATPDKGNFFVGWDQEGLEEDAFVAKGATATFTMPEGAVTVKAIFATAADDEITYDEDAADEMNAGIYAPVGVAQNLNLTNALDMISAYSPLKVTVKNLPAGLAFNAKTFAVTGKTTKPGFYTNVTIVAANSSTNVSFTAKVVVPNGGSFAGLEDVTTAVVSGFAGINFNQILAMNEGWEKANVKVSGLPAGLKFDAKTRTIAGVPTKAGVYTVVLTATDHGGKTSTSVVTAEVKAMPDWLVGTFNGAGVDDGDPIGTLALAVAKDGKATLTLKEFDRPNEASLPKVVADTLFKNLAPVAFDPEDESFIYVYEDADDDYAIYFELRVESAENGIGLATYSYEEYDGDNVSGGAGFLVQDGYARKFDGLLDLANTKVVLDLSEYGFFEGETLTLKFGKNGAVTPAYKYTVEGANEKVVTKTGLAISTPVLADGTAYVFLSQKEKFDEDLDDVAYAIKVTLNADGVVDLVPWMGELPEWVFIDK